MSSESSERAEAAPSDWATTRGKKWVENLAPTERMLAPVDAPLLSALLHEPPGKENALPANNGLRIADIGCGGGHTTQAIARALPSGDAVVHGVDVSPDVIEAAQKASAELRNDVAFYCADAGIAPPPAGQLYDRLSSRFGVMFFDEPERAFTNLCSWLTPGGHFAFAVWAELARNPWMSCLRQVIAGLAELPPPVPDSPGPFRYADAARFCALLERSGFVDVCAEPWEGKVLLGGGLSAAAAAAFCLSAFSLGELLGEDPTLLAQASTRLCELLKGYEADGVVLVPAAVHIVTGSVPA